MIYLDAGHGDKGDRYDPGAQLGGTQGDDGTEARLVRALRSLVAVELVAAGLSVAIVPDGPYHERHAWVRERQRGARERGLYLQLHGNAGGGTYALCEYDVQSEEGRRAAQCIVADLARRPQITAGQVRALESGMRGYTCIQGIWPVRACAAVLVEGAFLDAPSHAALWGEGMQAQAQAIAAGCLAWADL